ncbi:hypothetical protein BH10ACT2_BH10ACT2_18770 [soil metagenome]
MRRGTRRLRALSLTVLVVSSVVTSTGPVETVVAADAPWTTPTVPPKCSSEQADSGDVAGCLLSSNPGQPENRGWPRPPFPGEVGGGFPGTGWNFTGASYNGSPALAAWEAGFVRNAHQIGSVRPGQLSSQPDALPLYEGFLAEIQAGGYVVSSGSGAYSFRCTASTRKDCRGLTRDSLSNHAYGLASDINVSRNPMQTNYGINGATACQTPMKTDMPQWVIQVAEKWGLYWGGYGWSAGCSSPSQVKSSASRDPMHFEFNGSVEQARAILCHNLGNTAKFTVVDANGDFVQRCYGPNMPPAGTRMVIQTNAPDGANAALVNITGVEALGNGYFVAESCTTDAPAMRAWSNGNVRAGRNVAATAIVELDSQGRFCLYNSTAMHSIVDVQGYFASAASNSTLYTPITPKRTIDTRQYPFCTPEGACKTVGPIPAGMEIESAIDAPVDAVATVANITVASPSARGFLTADLCSAISPGPQSHSNINFLAGDVVANLTLSPSLSGFDEDQFCTYTQQAATNEIIDVQGFFAPAAGGGLGYASQTPERLVDTRLCWTDEASNVERCGEKSAAGDIIHMKAPAGAEAVVINITVAEASVMGVYVSAGPCSVIDGGGVPEFSNVNAVVGSAIANSAIVPVDSDGMFCAYVANPAYVIVDLMGTFSTSGLHFFAITPERVHDSRTLG